MNSRGAKMLISPCMIRKSNRTSRCTANSETILEQLNEYFRIPHGFWLIYKARLWRGYSSVVPLRHPVVLLPKFSKLLHALFFFSFSKEIMRFASFPIAVTSFRALGVSGKVLMAGDSTMAKSDTVIMG